MYLPGEVDDFLFKIPFIAFIFAIEAPFAGYYYMLGFGYFHIIFGVAVLLYSGIVVFKERNWVLFAVTVLAAGFSIWSNWFLMQH